MRWVRSGTAQPHELDYVLKTHPWISAHPQSLEILGELAHQGLLTWEYRKTLELFNQSGKNFDLKGFRKSIPYKKTGFAPPLLAASEIAKTRSEFVKDPRSIAKASRHLSATGVAHAVVQGESGNQIVVISVQGDSPLNRHARSLFIQYGVRLTYDPSELEKLKAGAYFDSMNLEIGTSQDAITWGKPSDPLHMHELVHLADWLKMVNKKPSAYLGEIRGQEGKEAFPLAFNDQTENYREDLPMSELNTFRFEIGRILDLLVRRRGGDPSLWANLRHRLQALGDLSERVRESISQTEGLLGWLGRETQFTKDPDGHYLKVDITKRLGAYDYRLRFLLPTDSETRNWLPQKILQNQLRLTKLAVQDATLLSQEAKRLKAMIPEGAREETLPVLRALRNLFRKRTQPGYPGYLPLSQEVLRRESDAILGLQKPPGWRSRWVDCVRTRLGFGQR